MESHLPMSNEMRIVGIDPGLQVTGYGCVELAPGGPALVEAGVIRLPRNRSLAERVGQLATDVGAILDELQPGRLVVEQVFSNARFVRTAILMGHARGAVLVAAATRDIEVAELAPAEIKKAIAGNGRASKVQMQEAVRAQCGLAERPEPHDVADAIAIALCGARRLASLDLAARSA